MHFKTKPPSTPPQKEKSALGKKVGGCTGWINRTIFGANMDDPSSDEGDLKKLKSSTSFGDEIYGKKNIYQSFNDWTGATKGGKWDLVYYMAYRNALYQKGKIVNGIWCITWHTGMCFIRRVRW
jgi:hypothetical protein